MQTDEESSDPRTPSARGIPFVVVPLLKGVLYRESNPDQWISLLSMQSSIRDYVSLLGLKLEIDEAEGYAFLRNRSGASEDDESEIPRLVSRRQLSFPVSLLLALLRKKMAEFDAGGGDTRLILSRDQIFELVRVFLAEGSNEARIIDQVDQHLNRVSELGFVRPLRGEEKIYEVRRIIKAFVDAQWLSDFEKRLEGYLAYTGERSGASDA